MTYTVTESRSQQMSFAGSKDSVSVTWSKDYFVEVGSPLDPATVTAYDVITATGLPIVNRSIYTIGTKIIPFVICRDKTAKQDPKRLARWTVSTKWKAVVNSASQESDNAPIDPPDALTDIAPRVVRRTGEYKEVLYEDKAGERILTPTGNQYAQPAIERVPTLILEISQYESALTDDELIGRKYRVNSVTYRTETRYAWLIEDVVPVEVEVLLSGGLTTAQLVTYTLVHSPRLYGWKDDRALIDSQYIEGGKTLPFLEGELRTKTMGLINVVGEKKADQTAAPDHVQFETFDEINFHSFLQV